jgi:two-component system chemotaxis response regulator CheB
MSLLPEFDPVWPAAYFITLHTGPRSLLPQVLQPSCVLPVKHAEHQEPIRIGTVYVAPSDHHLEIGTNDIQLSRGPKENWCRPAIDPMFRSAALAHGRSVIGVLMTGLLYDGANGLAVIQGCGGRTIVQDPDDAAAHEMPTAALRRLAPHYIVPLHEIGSVMGLCIGRRKEAAG